MDDAVFADVITVQDNKVYTKLSELKKASWQTLKIKLIYKKIWYIFTNRTQK
jgi:hypothetical protein